MCFRCVKITVFIKSFIKLRGEINLLPIKTRKFKGLKFLTYAKKSYKDASAFGSKLLIPNFRSSRSGH